jgi:precorrin-3B methylase
MARRITHFRRAIAKAEIGEKVSQVSAGTKGET